jgi:hypothetical protein
LSATKGRQPFGFLLITALPGLVCFAHHNGGGAKEQADPSGVFDQRLRSLCAGVGIREKLGSARGSNTQMPPLYAVLMGGQRCHF